MKSFLVFLAFALTIIACGSTEKSPANNSTTSQSTASTEPDGKKIYKQYCVTCHGLYGDMGASGALDLTASVLTLEERTVVITKGRGAMTPFENLLDADEIAAVAKYSLALKK